MIPLSDRQRLVEIMRLNGSFGAGIGLLFSVVLVSLDVQGLGTLLLADSDGLVSLLLLSFSFAMTFAGAAVATSVMFLSDDASEGMNGKRAPAHASSRPHLALRPVQVLRD